MLGTITESQLEGFYQDMLDECYGTVSVAGMEYATSRVLKEIDSIAYRVGMNDYADSMIQDGDLDGVEGWL